MAVEYRDPERLTEVLDVLREFGEDAKLVAGGHSLMVMLRQGVCRCTGYVKMIGAPRAAT